MQPGQMLNNMLQSVPFVQRDLERMPKGRCLHALVRSRQGIRRDEVLGLRQKNKPHLNCLETVANLETCRHERAVHEKRRSHVIGQCLNTSGLPVQQW